MQKKISSLEDGIRESWSAVRVFKDQTRRKFCFFTFTKYSLLLFEDSPILSAIFFGDVVVSCLFYYWRISYTVPFEN